LRPEAVEFLNDPEVRRLAVAWASFKFSGDDLKDAVGLSKKSGVPTRRVFRLRDILLANEIVFENGGLDQAAAQYIARLGVVKLRIPRREDKREEKK